MTTSSTEAVVQWMINHIGEQRCLYQHEVIDRLHREYASEHIRENNSGGESLAPEILSAFRKRTPDVVWVRSEQMWRPREASDVPGRQQD